MPRLDKIYTKGGDKGASHIANGERRAKTDLRFAVSGSIDQANSTLGLLICEDIDADLREQFQGIQHQLFDLGSDFSCPLDSDSKIMRMQSSHVEALESFIDALQEHLSPLENFILPGGTRAAALAHVVRCQVRNAEREAWALHETEACNEHALQYLNRLSDLFFVLARYVNIREDANHDVYWRAEQSLPVFKPSDA